MTRVSREGGIARQRISRIKTLVKPNERVLEVAKSFQSKYIGKRMRHRTCQTNEYAS